MVPIPLHCHSYGYKYDTVVLDPNWEQYPVSIPNSKGCGAGDRFTVAAGPNCYQNATTIFLSILGSNTIEEVTARSQWYIRPLGSSESPDPAPKHWHETLGNFVSGVWEIPFTSQSKNNGRVNDYNLWFAPKAAAAITSLAGNKHTYSFSELRTKALEHLCQLNRGEQTILWTEAKESLAQGRLRTASDRLWEIARIQLAYIKFWLAVSATSPVSTFTAIHERGNADSGFPLDPKISPAECRLHNVPLPKQYDSGSYELPKLKRYSGPSLLTQGVTLVALALLVRYRKALPHLMAQGIRALKRFP